MMSIDSQRLKIFYDAEFTGLKQNTKLISIGLISESGAHFYAEFNDFGKDNLTPWIENNVIKNLLYNEINNIHNEETFGEKVFVDGDTYYSHTNISMKSDSSIVAFKLRKWLNNEHMLSSKQIQIYTDCYAYDWVLFNNLISKTGNALDIPDYLYYIPWDLCTALQLNGIDPDINREEFVGEKDCNSILDTDVFKNRENLKHNSLWDAVIAGLCYNKITHLNK